MFNPTKTNSAPSAGRAGKIKIIPGTTVPYILFAQVPRYPLHKHNIALAPAIGSFLSIRKRNRPLPPSREGGGIPLVKWLYIDGWQHE